MIPDQHGRTGREWRFCVACQRADALRVVGKAADGKTPILQCAFCTPGAKLQQAKPAFATVHGTEKDIFT